MKLRHSLSRALNNLVVTELMGKPSDHPGFKALLKEWNQRLKDSGFKDDELHFDSGNSTLKRPGNKGRYRLSSKEVIEAKSEYFSLIQEAVDEAAFANELEEKILKLYAIGISKAEIKRSLKIEGNKSRVYEPIYKWLRRWGLK